MGLTSSFTKGISIDVMICRWQSVPVLHHHAFWDQWKNQKDILLLRYAEAWKMGGCDWEQFPTVFQREIPVDNAIPSKNSSRIVLLLPRLYGDDYDPDAVKHHTGNKEIRVVRKNRWSSFLLILGSGYERITTTTTLTKERNWSLRINSQKRKRKTAASFNRIYFWVFRIQQILLLSNFLRKSRGKMIGKD